MANMPVWWLVYVLVQAAVMGVAIYFAVRLGVRDGMTNFENRRDRDLRR